MLKIKKPKELDNGLVCPRKLVCAFQVCSWSNKIHHYLKNISLLNIYVCLSSQDRGIQGRKECSMMKVYGRYKPQTKTWQKPAKASPHRERKLGPELTGGTSPYLTTDQIQVGCKWSPLGSHLESLLLGAAGLPLGTVPLGWDAIQGISWRLRALPC